MITNATRNDENPHTEADVNEQEYEVGKDGDKDEVKSEPPNEILPEPMEEYIEKPNPITNPEPSNEVTLKSLETKLAKPAEVDRKTSISRRNTHDENKENREHRETKKRNRFSLLSFTVHIIPQIQTCLY